MKKNNNFIKEKVLEIFLISGINIILSLAILLVLTTFLWFFNVSISKLHFPLSFIFSSLTILFLFSKNKKNKIIGIILSLLVILFSVYMNGKIYDQTYDGNSYHKQAVIILTKGWDPITESYRAYNKRNELPNHHLNWIEHYPKTTWIIGSAIYKITGNIESGKSFNFFICFSAFFIFLYFLNKYLKNILFSFILSIVIVANPIMIAQVFSYYTDGFLGILLYIIILSMIILNKNDKYKDNYYILFSALILIINTKFTGLAYSGLFCFGIYIPYFIGKLKTKQYKNILNTVFFFLITIVLAVILVGSTSYVRNTYDHKNPFYPLAGKNKVDIMTHLQPASFSNYSPIKKNLYSIFSKTANIGVFNGGEPKLKIPFTFDSSETYFLCADIRIGGYGVLFSGLFLISIIYLIFRLKTLKKNEVDMFSLLLIPLLITVLLMFFLSDSWWARYSPQLYLFIIFALLIFFKENKITLKLIRSIFVLLIFLNLAIFVKNYFTFEFQKSKITSYNLSQTYGKTVYIWLPDENITGILANLDDKNINYISVDEKQIGMKDLYFGYMYYIEK